MSYYLLQWRREVGTWCGWTGSLLFAVLWVDVRCTASGATASRATWGSTASETGRGCFILDWCDGSVSGGYD